MTGSEKPTETALFIKAVLKGVRRGGRLIKCKRRGYTRYYAPENVLGEYDYTSVRLKIKPAYELYKGLSDAPLAVKEICAELRAAGISEGEPRALTVGGTRCTAITISRAHCKELNELILRFYL